LLLTLLLWQAVSGLLRQSFFIVYLGWRFEWKFFGRSKVLLSDLPNKEKLMIDTNGLLNRRAGSALLMIDLDNFKSVNDSKGHSEGDACLERVVNAIGDVLGRKGTLYRWGGDEFAIVLPDYSTEEAHATGERIRRAVEDARPGHDVAVTVSIGVGASDRKENPSFEELFDAADKAMYESKNKGKNRVTSWPFHERAAGGTTR
jgi:diguanylate cyclase (GGDEF)-like protein